MEKQCVNYHFVLTRAFPHSLQTLLPTRLCLKIRTNSSAYLNIVARRIPSCHHHSTPFSTFIGYGGIALNAFVKFQESVTHYAGRVQAQRRNLRNTAVHRMYEASRIDAIHLRPCLLALLSLACRPLSRRIATPPRILPVCSSFT